MNVKRKLIVIAASVMFAVAFAGAPGYGQTNQAKQAVPCVKPAKRPHRKVVRRTIVRQTPSAPEKPVNVNVNVVVKMPPEMVAPAPPPQPAMSADERAKLDALGDKMDAMRMSQETHFNALQAQNDRIQDDLHSVGTWTKVNTALGIANIGLSIANLVHDNNGGAVTNITQTVTATATGGAGGTGGQGGSGGSVSNSGNSSSDSSSSSNSNSSSNSASGSEANSGSSSSSTSNPPPPPQHNGGGHPKCNNKH